jgi:hypothetical protein
MKELKEMRRPCWTEDYTVENDELFSKSHVKAKPYDQAIQEHDTYFKVQASAKQRSIVALS